LSKASLTLPAVAVETRTDTSADVAVASATVEASMILNDAVPDALPVTGHSWRLSAASKVHATGVSDPAMSAEAADVA